MQQYDTIVERKIKLPYMDPERVSKEIGDFVIDRVYKANATGCVIGLSGGIDSTTTAAVIKKAFDDHNQHSVKKLELVGYMVPSRINSEKDTADGIRIAKFLGLRYEVVNLDKVIDAFYTTNPEAMDNRFDRGNVISRIRANVLSTKAATEKKIIAGTGNKDEDFGVGYYTLFGDGAVHMSPIGNLSKRLVRDLASYLGISKDMVYREPTAGLEPGQTDFKDLGYGYDVVELVTEGISQGKNRDSLVNDPQIISLAESQIRTLDQPRLKTVDAIVDDIICRNKIALFKSQILHPPIAPVTLEYR